MSNINLIVTNPNDVHRILKDFENDNRKKRCRDHDDHSRKIVSQSQKTITLEEFLEERNSLVMRLDKNSKKRLLETTHPPQFYQPQSIPYSYHPSVQFFPNTGVPTPYNMYGGQKTGHPEKSNTSPRQLELHSPSTTQQQHHSRQQQQKKKKSTNGDVSSPELFRGLMDEIGDIDEV